MAEAAARTTSVAPAAALLLALAAHALVLWQNAVRHTPRAAPSPAAVRLLAAPEVGEPTPAPTAVAMPKLPPRAAPILNEKTQKIAVDAARAAPVFVASSASKSEEQPAHTSPQPAAADVHWPVALPERWQGSYAMAVTRRGQTAWGQAQVDWQLNTTPGAARYELRLSQGEPADGALPTRVRPREHTSSGLLGAHGLQPERLRQKGRGELAAHIERDAGDGAHPANTARAVFSNNRPSATVPAHAQDRLSVLAQLAGWFAAANAQQRAERFATGASIDIPTVGLGGAGVWRFVVLGEAALPAGPREGAPSHALALVKMPRFEHDARVEVWLDAHPDFPLAAWRVTRASGDGELHLRQP